jgi:hypothetical protein
MERDTLIKVFALLFIVAFVIEMFGVRSSVTNTPTQNTENTSKEHSVYGSGETTATLLSYSDYLNVFKPGVDISENSSIGELVNVDGVGYVNRHGGMVTLILEQGANVSLIADEVKERFPDLNVTANALFSLPPEVELTTAAGKRNVSANAIIAIEIEPEIDVGDNVTLSLVGLVAGNEFDGTPVAKIIPTNWEVVANAVVSGVGDDYSAVVILPWSSRNINVSKVKEELSSHMENVNISYAPDSYVAVKGLSLKENDTIKKIGNISYVTEVDGDLVYVKDDFNNSGELEADLKGILGDNSTVDYPLSKMNILFSARNVSESDILKYVKGEVILYREIFLEMSGKIRIGSKDYNVPSNTTFDVMLLESSPIGQNISVQLKIGTLGRNIVNLELEKILG